VTYVRAYWQIITNARANDEQANETEEGVIIMKNDVFRKVVIKMRTTLALLSLLMVLGAGGAYAQVTMGVGSVTAKIGDTVNVPINVTNFTNVGAISLKLSYNAVATTFLGISGAPAGVSFLATSTTDVITLGWFDATASNPINLGNGVLLNLRVIYNGGPGMFTFNTGVCEIANAAGNSVPVLYTGGSVTPLALGVTVGTALGVIGDTVTVPVNVTNFSSVGAISLKIQFDPNVLQFATVANTAAAMTYTANATNGVLTLGWFDITGNTPVTLGAAKLMDLKFVYKGGVTNITPLGASSEIVNKSGDAITVQYTNGKVSPAAGQALTLSLADVNYNVGSAAVIPLTVEKFTKVGAVSVKIQYNAAVLSFTGITNPATAGISATANLGVLTLAWFDVTGNTPLSVGTGGKGKLADLNFTYNGGTTPLSFIDALTEIADSTGTKINAAYKNGSIILNLSPTMNAIAAVSKKEQDTVSIIVSGSDANTNDVLVYSAKGLPVGATFTALTRKFSWIPGLNTAGVYNVKFFVSDGQSADSTVAVITITKNNIKPTFTAIPAISKKEQDTVSFVVTATDPNASDSILVYSALSTPTGATFTPATRKFMWVPGLNTAGTYNVKFVVSDGFLTDTTAAVITITKNNVKPVFVSKVPVKLDSVQINLLYKIAFKVTASDLNKDTLTYTWYLNNVSVQTGKDSTYQLGAFTTSGSQRVVCVFADNGDLKDSTVWTIISAPKVTDVEPAIAGVPTVFSLGQNYPNPFNPSTTIKFGLPNASPVTLEIYNILGAKVRTLLSGTMMSAAFHNIVWDGRNDVGSQVSSGMYLYRIVADKHVSTMKMLLMK